MLRSRFLTVFVPLCLVSLTLGTRDSYNDNESIDASNSASVYCSDRVCKLIPNVLDWHNASALGTFKNSLLKTGWGILDINAGHAWKKDQMDTDVMFAAGFIEGALTADQIESQFKNLFNIFFQKSVDQKVLEKLDSWFREQRAWADMMIAQNPADPLWRHASYILAQFDGLYAGYRSVRNPQTALDVFAISFLNANGDLFDLLKVVAPEKFNLDWTKFSREEAQKYFYTTGHCSALIKMLPGYENIYMSHSSWFAYQATNRIYKHYNFNVSDEATASKKISFSSYGGYLESLDDFYHLGSGMVMLQTTNNVFNISLYQYVSEQSLLAWQRVRVANMLAKSGREWAAIISKYNSGTYNNQYMVLDLKLIELKMPLKENTLWVAEQIPGLVVAQDVTKILSDGYFPSYNIPFFEEIYNLSGYPDYVKAHGVEFTYQLAPRAKIFRRDQSKVVDLDSMKKIMRYNDYKNDPYSGGSAWGAICSRGDLSGTPSADGCYDTKVSDFSMAKAFQADIISGPTLGDNLPPFSWTGKWKGLSHVGLPQVYNFTFIRTQPSLE